MACMLFLQSLQKLNQITFTEGIQFYKRKWEEKI